MVVSNDRLFRLYGYPLFCLITNLTFFLINPYERVFNAWRQFTALDFVVNTLVSIVHPVLVLETAIQLSRFLRNRLPWDNNLKTRFIVQFLLHISIIFVVAYLFFHIPFPPKFAFNQLLFRQVVITGIIFSLLTTSVFAAEHLFYRLNDARLETSKLNELAVQAQLDALKLQLDPHFLFNNLSALTSLIEENPALSVEYVGKLSSIYRYMLSNRTRNTVALSVELDFIRNFLFLHQIRYGTVIRVNIAPEVEASQQEIAPVTLQLLIENAIKHNQFSAEKPLNINICLVTDQWLVIRNNKHPKHIKEQGAQVGLKNIIERYWLLNGVKPVINETTDSFEVKIPLLCKNKDTYAAYTDH
jgi:sensor histidine kinase YesM